MTTAKDIYVRLLAALIHTATNWYTCYIPVTTAKLWLVSMVGLVFMMLIGCADGCIHDHKAQLLRKK